MGERYPNAEIIATDISVFQATYVPSNVVFQVDDARGEWTYTQLFGFIHIQGLARAFSDWPEIYAKAFRHLKQGGFLEVADFGFARLSGNIRDPYVDVFNGACQSAADKARDSVRIGTYEAKRTYSGWLCIRKTSDYSGAARHLVPDLRKHLLGKMALIAILEGLEAVSLRFLTKQLGWKADDVRELCGRVKEVASPGARVVTSFQFLVARRLL